MTKHYKHHASKNKIKLPLIKQLKELDKTIEPKIEILYFTDPICSTCWLVQPQL